MWIQFIFNKNYIFGFVENQKKKITILDKLRLYDILFHIESNYFLKSPFTIFSLVLGWRQRVEPPFLTGILVLTTIWRTPLCPFFGVISSSVMETERLWMVLLETCERFLELRLSETTEQVSIWSRKPLSNAIIAGLCIYFILPKRQTISFLQVSAGNSIKISSPSPFHNLC